MKQACIRYLCWAYFHVCPLLLPLQGFPAVRFAYLPGAWYRDSTAVFIGRSSMLLMWLQVTDILLWPGAHWLEEARQFTDLLAVLLAVGHCSQCRSTRGERCDPHRVRRCPLKTEVAGGLSGAAVSCRHLLRRTPRPLR